MTQFGQIVSVGRVFQLGQFLVEPAENLGHLFFASPDADRTLWDVDYPERTVLIFGRESVGLPSAIRERNRDRLFRLPMRDPALRSVNVSTAVGIVLYEVLRQRGG